MITFSRYFMINWIDHEISWKCENALLLIKSYRCSMSIMKSISVNSSPKRPRINHLKKFTPRCEKLIKRLKINWVTVCTRFLGRITKNVLRRKKKQILKLWCFAFKVKRTRLKVNSVQDHEPIDIHIFKIQQKLP